MIENNKITELSPLGTDRVSSRVGGVEITVDFEGGLRIHMGWSGGPIPQALKTWSQAAADAGITGKPLRATVALYLMDGPDDTTPSAEKRATCDLVEQLADLFDPTTLYGAAPIVTTVFELAHALLDSMGN